MTNAREKANAIAIRKGYALYVKAGWLWGVDAMEQKLLICKVRPLLNMWDRAIDVLVRLPEPSICSGYLLTLPDQTRLYSESFIGLVYLYLCYRLCR